MPRVKHQDRVTLKTAIREIYWNPLGNQSKVGKLPAVSDLQVLLNYRVHNDPINKAAKEKIIRKFGIQEDEKQRVNELPQKVLKYEKYVGRDTIREIKDSVLKEFEAGSNFCDTLFFERFDVERITDEDVWGDAIPDWNLDTQKIFDDDRAEVILLNNLSKMIFGKNLPRVSKNLLLELQGSLYGLDPAARLFLLYEFAIRESMQKAAVLDSRLNKLAGIRDLQFLISLKQWYSPSTGNPRNVPWSFMQGYEQPISNLNLWVGVLEPLCQPEWKPIRQWFLNTLYGAEDSNTEGWCWQKIVEFKQSGPRRNEPNVFNSEPMDIKESINRSGKLGTKDKETEKTIVKPGSNRYQIYGQHGL